METTTGKTVTPHILTVTGHYDLSEAIDGREFTLSCPGVLAGDCVAYTPCDVADCPVRTDPRWDGGGEAHGVEHTVVDGELPDVMRTAAGAELEAAVVALHRRVLAGIGDGSDLATAGRRRIVARHTPSVTGRWIDCHGPHGREGGEHWPCEDYRDAAGEAGNPLPPEGI